MASGGSGSGRVVMKDALETVQRCGVAKLTSVSALSALSACRPIVKNTPLKQLTLFLTLTIHTYILLLLLNEEIKVA